MSIKDVAAFRLSSFQSFDEEGATVLSPCRFNVFVGPNNVGKSKLVRAFDKLITGSRGKLLDSQGVGFKFFISKFINETIALNLVNALRQSRQIYREDDSQAALASLVKGRIEYEMSGDAPTATFHALHLPKNNKFSETQITTLTKAAHSHKFLSYPIPKSNFFYLGAERNVVPETANSNVVEISPNGQGTTALIRKYLLQANTNTDLVRVNMLQDLNEILYPDYYFTDIRCQEDGGSWEIYLETKKYGEIALSQSGSGLKTILQLLANTQLVVGSGDKQIEKGLFLFEEIENALHPKMQRNVYKYIREKFTGDSICVFSTHSPIAIDFFQADEEAVTYEVFQENDVTTCRRVEAFKDSLGVLDALGVKASDALQSNFIVWVEGPTDRIYIKKWMSIFGHDDLLEGRDFSIMFYGGKLLSHLTLSEDDASTEFIRLLKINPKCAVIIDSDREKKQGWISGTKKRLRKEANANAKLCWVTKGREMENYVTTNFWVENFGLNAEDVGDYVNIFDVLKEKEVKIGNRKVSSKMQLATFVAEKVTRADANLDIEWLCKDLVKSIRSANE